jgi:hypothetical protein
LGVSASDSVSVAAGGFDCGQDEEQRNKKTVSRDAHHHAHSNHLSDDFISCCSIRPTCLLFDSVVGARRLRLESSFEKWLSRTDRTASSFVSETNGKLAHGS